jgi:hypothetical protein
VKVVRKTSACALVFAGVSSQLETVESLGFKHEARQHKSFIIYSY